MTTKKLTKKSLIRKGIFIKRKEASPEDMDKWSLLIAEKVFQTDLYKCAKTIYSYVSYNKEVETRNIIERAWADGKTVAVPRVEGDVMNFYQIHSYDELEHGCKGILEPVSNVPVHNEHVLMIMPVVAFTKKRDRIGYGGGYYDKYLEAHPHLNTLAIAFEFQLVDEVPVEPTDISPEMIITENAVY